MTAVALVSVLCADRIGLVSAITSHLFDTGINLRDTSFAVLGQGAEFTSVCELPGALTIAALQAGLEQLPELAGGQVTVRRFVFEPALAPQGRITHRIEVSGGDQLGLIARLSDIFTQFGANIVRMDAQTIPAAWPHGERYVTRFSVWLPADRAATCLAEVANTAGSLGLVSTSTLVEQAAVEQAAGDGVRG
ncbi:MAG: amino acid-binding protein [Azospirillaceae bacterium]|nr:amino acid-binding protein [Azospirillaceae bacterium]